MARTEGRGARAIKRLFLDRYKPGATEIAFHRDDLQAAARLEGIDLPKNAGAVIYDYRYRTTLPKAIRDLAPKDKPHWIIRGSGKSKYRFAAVTRDCYLPQPTRKVTLIPDATPEIIAKYALDDEQAMLARLRYNRLIDTFTRVTCYSLQSHLRTETEETGQLETDELYVGVDRNGAHYVLPVQAKGIRDKLGVVQILQDFELCATKFGDAIPRPIGAISMGAGRIALMEFSLREGDIPAIRNEHHFKLVPAKAIDESTLDTYRKQAERPRS